MDSEQRTCYNCYEPFPKLRQTQLVGNTVWLCDACTDVADVATVRCDRCKWLEGQLEFAVGQAEKYQNKATLANTDLDELRGQIAALLESYRSASQGRLGVT